MQLLKLFSKTSCLKTEICSADEYRLLTLTPAVALQDCSIFQLIRATLIYGKQIVLITLIRYSDPTVIKSSLIKQQCSLLLCYLDIGAHPECYQVGPPCLLMFSYGDLACFAVLSIAKSRYLPIKLLRISTSDTNIQKDKRTSKISTQSRFATVHTLKLLRYLNQELTGR